MEYHDWIQLFFDRSNALVTYETVYISVIGALLAFCATRESLNLPSLFILTVAFGLFAAANLKRIHEVQVQQSDIEQTIKRFPQNNPRPLIESHINAEIYDGPHGIKLYHITCDILAVSAIWAMGYSRRHSKAKPKS